MDAKKQQRGRESKWPAWYASLREYRASSNRRAAWQVANTLVPYFALWGVMIWTIRQGYSYWLTLALALVAALLLVRVFILFHDCVHGSLFPKKRTNTVFGYLLGLLVFTPFEDWRFSHLRHHATYADLDSRGLGDIWTMTKQEYKTSSKKTRLSYRLFRNPVVMIGLGPVFSFLLRFRLPSKMAKRKARVNVLVTNLLIAAIILTASLLMGVGTYIGIQLPVIWIAGALGIWLFYVQHQFRGVYWARGEEWSPLRAAMEGSSFYKLPGLLRWFSSNIGYHHVHHLSPRIPNYLLKQCYDSIPALRVKRPLTISESLSCMRLKLWDEERKEMVGFP
ncbi:MAG: fatty acid desaturase [Sediminispirochaetaceae bacterium]